MPRNLDTRNYRWHLKIIPKCVVVWNVSAKIIILLHQLLNSVINASDCHYYRTRVHIIRYSRLSTSNGNRANVHVSESNDWSDVNRVSDQSFIHAVTAGTVCMFHLNDMQKKEFLHTFWFQYIVMHILILPVTAWRYLLHLLLNHNLARHGTQHLDAQSRLQIRVVKVHLILNNVASLNSSASIQHIVGCIGYNDKNPVKGVKIFSAIIKSILRQQCVLKENQPQQRGNKYTSF